MPTVVGVKLRFAPKVLHFDPAGAHPEVGDRVIVETERGEEYGEIVELPHEIEKSEVVSPLKPILRLASAEDVDNLAELEELEADAMPVFREYVKKHKLDMKPIDVEYLFDRSKIIFYFSAEERVDFRELVRDLASRFKARIDMRQVGVRDEARMVGGIGHCGEILCCVRFPGDFQPVSIRMAKEQDLPLNPLKISGLCGRLMCCLRYEFDAYKDFKSRAPKRGAMISTPVGDAKVVELNTPLETATLRMPDGKNLKMPVSCMECEGDSKRPCKVSRETLEELGAPSVTLAEAEPTPERSDQPSRTRRDRKGRDSKPRGKSDGRKPSGDKGKTGEGSQKKDSSDARGSKRSRGRRSRGGSKGQRSQQDGQKQGQSSEKGNQGPAPKKDGERTDSQGRSSTGRRRRRRRRPSEGDKGQESTS